MERTFEEFQNINFHFRQAIGKGKQKVVFKPSGTNRIQESSQKENLEVAVVAQILEMGNHRKHETSGANSESIAGTSEGSGSTPDSVAKWTRSAQKRINPEGEATFLEDKTWPSYVEEPTPRTAKDAADPVKLKGDE